MLTQSDSISVRVNFSHVAEVGEAAVEVVVGEEVLDTVEMESSSSGKSVM